MSEEIALFPAQGRRWPLTKALAWRCSFEPAVTSQQAFDELRLLCLSRNIKPRGRCLLRDEGYAEEVVPDSIWLASGLVIDETGQPTGELRINRLRQKVWDNVWFYEGELLTPWWLSFAPRLAAAGINLDVVDTPIQEPCFVADPPGGDEYPASVLGRGTSADIINAIRDHLGGRGTSTRDAAWNHVKHLYPKAGRDRVYELYYLVAGKKNRGRPTSV